MNVLIIDNNELEANKLFMILKDFFILHKVCYEIQIATSLIAKDINVSYDLVFLDIDNLEDINLLKKLKKGRRAKIILTSYYRKYAIEGYKVNAERYFLKPINIAEFNKEMYIMLRYDILNNLYLDQNIISYQKIYYGDILYVEVLQKHSYLHILNNTTICSNSTLKFWEKIFSNAFFSKSHKSFLVNLQNISSLNSNNINLINSEKIPLSRKYKVSFINDYRAYLDIIE